MIATILPSSIVHPRSGRHRRGAAMIEMVLVMPLLLAVMAFVVFFGRGMVRAQHAHVMARYETWRAVAEAPGPSTNAHMNQTFFGDNAQRIDRSISNELPDDAEQALRNAAGMFSVDTRDLVNAALDRFPAGRTTLFRTEHANTVRAYEPFEGPLRLRHTRIGNNWKYANGFVDVEGMSWNNFGWWNRPPDYPWSPDVAGNVYGYWQAWEPHDTWWHGGRNVALLPAVREVFFPELDDRLASFTGNPLADHLRSLFDMEPHRYAGPTVFFVR